MTFKPFTSQRLISRPFLSKLSGVAIILCVTTLGLAGCDKASDNPKLQTFHPSSADWQQEIKASYAHLTDEERQLLDRYIERINANDAVKKGASETISIGEAIERQQTFEATSQEAEATQVADDTVSTVDSQASNSELYPLTLTLLPTPNNENTDVKKTPLEIEFKNEGEQTLLSFKGTVHLNVANLDEPKAVVIPLTQFNPPLNAQDTAIIAVDTNITDEQVIKALQDPQSIPITINKGTLKAENDTTIEFEAENAQ